LLGSWGSGRRILRSGGSEGETWQLNFEALGTTFGQLFLVDDYGHRRGTTLDQPYLGCRGSLC